jgi:hypothetical protein
MNWNVIHSLLFTHTALPPPSLPSPSTANFFTPKVKAEPIGKAAGNPADSSHPEHTVLIQDNPLLHNNKDQ